MDPCNVSKGLQWLCCQTQNLTKNNCNIELSCWPEPLSCCLRRGKRERHTHSHLFAPAACVPLRLPMLIPSSSAKSSAWGRNGSHAWSRSKSHAWGSNRSHLRGKNRSHVPGGNRSHARDRNRSHARDRYRHGAKTNHMHGAENSQKCIFTPFHAGLLLCDVCLSQLAWVEKAPEGFLSPNS